MKLRWIIAVGTIIALGGCAVGVNQMTGPEGKTAYSLKCAGFMRTLEDCYKEAANLCPAGYDLAAQPQVDAGGGSSMLVTCR